METLTISISPKERKKLTALLTPLNDQIILAVDAAESRTRGGLILPESAAKTPETGTIVAVGPGSVNPMTGERVPLAVVVGDRVIFGRYAGYELVYNGHALKAMREADLVTVLNGEGEA